MYSNSFFSYYTGNIRVFCRVRPFLPDEKCGSPTPVLTLGSSKLLLRIADKKSKQYSFDKVFHPQSSQGSDQQLTCLRTVEYILQ